MLTEVPKPELQLFRRKLLKLNIILGLNLRILVLEGLNFLVHVEKRFWLHIFFVLVTFFHRHALAESCPSRDKLEEDWKDAVSNIINVIEKDHQEW